MERIPYRQIHLDFHTNETIEEVGSSFNSEEFIRTLKNAHVNSINLFTKCHHGMYYYPSSVGTQHPGLKGFDLFGSQIQACREAGIRAVAYTCVAWNEDWANRHPEWLCVNFDGIVGNKRPFEDGYYKWNSLCINHPEYRKVMKEELRETFEKYHPDGFWIDIIVSYECVCPVCKADMLRRGMDPSDMEQVHRHDRMSEIAFCKDIYDFLKELSPDLEIYFNSMPYALDDGRDPETSSVTKRKYFTFQDIESLPSDNWGYSHFPISANYIGKYDQEITMMNGKFHFSWGDFGSVRNEAALEYECFRAAAYGAKICVGDQLHPMGKLDPAVYERIGRVFQSIEEKEPWLKNTKSVCETGVFIVSNNTNKPEQPALLEEGIYRILTELHIPFHFLNNLDSLEGYKLLILADHFVPDEKLAARIDAFVENGGKLLITGNSGVRNGEFVLNCIHAEFLGESPYSKRYIRLDPAIFQGIPEMDHVLYERGYSVKATENTGENTAAYIVYPYFERTYQHFCSHRQAPPKKQSDGEPAIITGKNYVYISSPLFTDYILNGYVVHREIIRKMISYLVPDKMIETDLPVITEVTVRENETAAIVHLLNYVLQRMNKRIDTVEEKYYTSGKYIELKADCRPSRVMMQPQGEELSFTYDNGYVHVDLPTVSGHTMIEFVKGK